VPLLEYATLSVSIFDKLGRKFDNFSSVYVEWKLSDVSLGNIAQVLSGSEDLGQRTEYRRKFFFAPEASVSEHFLYLTAHMHIFNAIKLNALEIM